VWRALKYFCPERVVDKHATTKAEKENNKAQTHNQFCEVMAIGLIYNPWVLEDAEAEEAAAEDDGRTYMGHPGQEEC
jgi:hypothetical protein